MNETKLLDLLKKPSFVQRLIKASSKEDLSLLFLENSIIASDEEIEELEKVVTSIKNSLSEMKKVDTNCLEKISGGKREIAKKIIKPIYYTGYGLGYAAGKVPIVGYTVYHSIKDAIRGFYEAL